MKRNGNGRLFPEKMAEGLRKKIQEHSEYQAEVREKFLAAVPFFGGDQDPVEFVGLMQEVRSARILSDHIEFFLLVLGLEGVSDGRISEVDERDFTERFEALQEEYGIDEGDEDFHIDDAPVEYKALNREYVAMTERIFAAVCREFGEARIAELYEQDRAEFDRRREEGRAAIHGSHEENLRMVQEIRRDMESEGDDV